MDFSIVNLSPANSSDMYGIEDATKPLFYALQRLGYKVELLNNRFSRKAKNIVFGLHDMQEEILELIPAGSIIYNFEQFTPGSKAISKHYLAGLLNFEVWDYSERNLERLKKFCGVKNIKHVPLGYSPEITRLDPNYPKDIDVLFYGCMNKRRIKILEELKAKGLKLVAVSNCYGEERDVFIARSKIVMNIHYYTPGILESVRLGYLLANQKTIVSELNSDSEMYASFENTCIFCPYEQLVDMVFSLSKNEALCKKQAQRGFEIFSNNKYEDILRSVL